MKTKFDIGEKVLVEAEVIEIKITAYGEIRYVLNNDNWTNLEKFDEEEIIKLEQLKEQNE